MATIAHILQETSRQPRLALNLALERTVAGIPTVAEFASVIGVVTTVFELAEADRKVERSFALPGLRVAVLAVVEHDGAPLVIAGGGAGGGAGWVRSWRLDGTPGALHVDANDGAIRALAVVEHDGAPLVIGATHIGTEGRVRSWRLDGTPGPWRADTNDGAIGALAVVEHDSAPLVIAGGGAGGGAGWVRIWWLNGAARALRIDTNAGPVGALAVVEHDGAPLIIAGGGAHGESWVHSWWLDGAPGPLRVDTNDGAVGALAVVEHDGAPLIIGATHVGGIGWVRSWRLDGTPGPLRVDAVNGWADALAVVDHDGAPLIIVGGIGWVHSWRVSAGAAASLARPAAMQIDLRRLSFASPLELEILVPIAALTPTALSFVLYAVKRLWTFPIELRIHDARMRATLIEAKQELERLEATREADAACYAARDAVIDAWNMIDATLTDDEAA